MTQWRDQSGCFQREVDEKGVGGRQLKQSGHETVGFLERVHSWRKMVMASVLRGQLVSRDLKVMKLGQSCLS